MSYTRSTCAELLITYLEVALSFVKIAEDTGELQHAVSACCHARDVYERVTHLLLRCDLESSDYSIVDALRIHVTDRLGTLDTSLEQRAHSQQDPFGLPRGNSTGVLSSSEARVAVA